MYIYTELCKDCDVPIQSSGDLQNDEETASVMLMMVKNSVKLVKSVKTEKNSGIQRLSGKIYMSLFFQSYFCGLIL